MHDLGLAFGCLDFIVTPDGKYVFLEVNQMGQFLWVEVANPDLLVLDAFCHLLVSGTADFPWAPQADALRVADFIDVSGDASIDERHVPVDFSPPSAPVRVGSIPGAKPAAG